ncbi:MAG: hypothetical protein ACXAC7_17430, partial [Candidatus Hodarchaeales archaeon]
KYPILIYYPAICAIIFFSALLLNILIEPVLIFFFLGNVILFPIIYITRMLPEYNFSFDNGTSPLGDTIKTYSD